MEWKSVGFVEFRPEGVVIHINDLKEGKPIGLKTITYEQWFRNANRWKANNRNYLYEMNGGG